MPITGDGAEIRINGRGTVVEWAVKMERLPESATLGDRLARGDVAADSLEELARRLAQFHAHAEAGPKVALGGSFLAVARNALENFEQSTDHVGTTLSRSTFERLKSLTEAALVEKRALIEDRAQRGIPRDTHGDLRLDHIYWFPERHPPDDWAIVDCIEFNERFRHADPIAELAFLAMDLTLEAHSDEARTFVEAYLQAAGDDEGRALLPFYRAYRAAVRGKVEGMKLGEKEILEADRSKAHTRARALWLYALSELEAPRGKPCLVLVAGLPGTGKSTLARRLGDEAGLMVIRSDVVRKELTAEAGEARSEAGFDGGFYTAAWNDRTYEECLRRADEILFEGGRVLIDASFRHESHRRLFLDAAHRCGIPACLILCQADAGVVRERLAGRRGDASDADWAIHTELARHWDDLSSRTRTVTCQVDTGGSLNDSTTRAIEVLRGSGLVGADPDDAHHVNPMPQRGRDNAAQGNALGTGFDTTKKP